MKLRSNVVTSNRDFDNFVLTCSHSGAGDGAVCPAKFQPKPPSTPPPTDRKPIGKRRLRFRPSGAVRSWSEGDALAALRVVKDEVLFGSCNPP